MKRRARLGVTGSVHAASNKADTVLDIAELDRAGAARFRRQAPGQLRLVEISGPAALAESAPWVDRVHADAHVSLLARRRWLEAWTKAFRSWEPWVLTLLADDEPLAVAPLVRRRARSGFVVVSMGADQLNESPVVARGELGTAGLAASIAHALESLEAPWSLRLCQLPSGSPLARALLAGLEPSRMERASPRPVLRLAHDGPPQRSLTSNTRAALAKARNRIRREGHRLEVSWTEDWTEIRALLPEIIDIHRARDFELRGMTLLDDPEEADFYREVLTRHADKWRVLMVRIDDALAGYAICLRDDRILRVWDNRVAPDWRRYSAGLIANAEVVLSAAADQGVVEVDWGCGVQRYKTSMSNNLMTGDDLMAWSSVLLRARRVVARRLSDRGLLQGGG